MSEAAAPPVARPAPSIEHALAERTLVLVVDDHPINRMVLARQVRALGYAAEVAEDGLQALEMWNGDRYGLVITDCNMPELSGYQLARHIRSTEARQGALRTPVIACTANALGGEAERCLAEGMDDYLSKPVELRRLAEKLQRWLPLPETPAVLEGMPDSLSNVAPLARHPFDAAVVDEISAGNPVVAREVLTRFHRYNSEDAAALRSAVLERDAARVQAATHRVRGSSRTVGATDLAVACERMERAAAAGDWPEVEDAMQAFDREVARMEAHIAGLAA
jgi:CheY-like chemotaxis protein/HPt (histidine-containing phosphotransfer) domain-containing protein